MQLKEAAAAVPPAPELPQRRARHPVARNEGGVGASRQHPRVAAAQHLARGRGGRDARGTVHHLVYACVGHVRCESDVRGRRSVASWQHALQILV